MALPDVKILIQSGALGGLVPTSDATSGMVLTGASEGSVTTGTPFLITSYQAAIDLGLTVGNNPLALKEIKDFYSEAPLMTPLYILLQANTVTVDQMCDKDLAYAPKLLDYASGKVRLFGAMYVPGTTPTITAALDAKVGLAVTKMQALGIAYAQKQWPIRGIIGGNHYSGAAASLTDHATGGSSNRAAIVIGDTVAGDSAALGLTLGRMAASGVQRKISRVKSGALLTATAFINKDVSGTPTPIPAEQYTLTQEVHNRGYITFRKFANKNGYYFSGDPACVASTDDYSFIARGRVVDKMHVITYATYVEEVDEEVRVDESGKLDAGYCKYLEKTIERQLNLSMTANNELSAVEAFVDPNQDVLATNKIIIVLKGTPVGYGSQFEIKLGFKNPAA